MKKVIIFLICIFLSLTTISPALCQSEQYLKVSADNVHFLNTNGASVPLFTLKKGVYVKLIDESRTDYYEVEYCGAIGYVAISDFAQDNTKYQDIQNPYHAPITLSLTQNAFTEGKAILYVTPNWEYPVPGLTIEQNDSFNLIGTYVLGENTFLYLSITKNGSMHFGSINKAYTNWDEASNPITPPSNGQSSSNDLISTPTTPSDAPTTVEPTNNLVRVILIIGICIPSFIIVYLIFKPIKPHNSGKERRRSQDDYEDFE